ncbi:MAG: multinuclear nonheme iron-dependent oxidase, partial [Polaromonas sp.]
MSLPCANFRVTPDPMPLAAGVGLRFPHHQAFVDKRPSIGWLEVHAENYMGGGTPLRYLETLRRDYPVSFHGIGLSLGSADGLDPAHLDRLARVIERIEPQLVSEHLSWSVVGQTYLADLLPLPMTQEALDVVCRHVDQVQTRLGRRI